MNQLISDPINISAKESEVLTYSGEFRDTKLELDYLTTHQKERTKVAFWVLFIGAMVYALAVLVDYAKLGFGADFVYLLINRTVYVVTSITVAFSIKRLTYPTINKVLSAAVLICAICISIVPIYRVDDRVVYEMITIFVVLFNYAIFPVSMRTRVTQGMLYLVLTIGFMLYCQVETGSIISMTLLLLMANSVGFFSGRRFNHQSRIAWWRNELLNQEIEAHKATLAAQKALEAKLRNQAYTDSLTNTHNRRSFFEHGVIAMNDPRQRNSMALIMFDLDHFKKVNDTYGHEAGDQVLVDITRTCEENLREDDLLARLGGEEFAILLFNTNPQQAYKTADRIRKAIDDTDTHYSGSVITTSISIGLVDKLHLYGSLDKAMVHADMALYRAKEAGRNQVQVHEN